MRDLLLSGSWFSFLVLQNVGLICGKSSGKVARRMGIETGLGVKFTLKSNHADATPLDSSTRLSKPCDYVLFTEANQFIFYNSNEQVNDAI